MIKNSIPKDLVFTGPSGGAGKTYLAKQVLQLCPDHKFLVSHTTRNPREGEVHGKDYFFLDTEEEFLQMVKNNEFLEWNNPRKGVYYGTSHVEYDRVKASGKNAVFDVDYVGAISLRKKLGEDAYLVGLIPDRETRLRWMNNRKDGMTEEEKLSRLNRADVEEIPALLENVNIFNKVLRDYNEDIQIAMLANEIAHIAQGIQMAV